MKKVSIEIKKAQLTLAKCLSLEYPVLSQYGPQGTNSQYYAQHHLLFPC